MNRSLVVELLLLAPVFLSAQSAFEVADVKPSDPSVIKAGRARVSPGGRIDVPGYTVKELMIFSFGVTGNMISGGPKWIDEDRFDIVAKAPTEVPIEALRLMMQTLLADRFRLAIHHQDKAMPAYALTLSKNPPNLHQSSGGPSLCDWHDLGDGIRRRECQNLTLEEFAKQLPITGGIGIDLPVVDQTGLKGGYDFQFEVGTVQRKTGPDTAGETGAGLTPVDADFGPTIFAALLKIGLKLESRKVPMPVIVIDQVERPSGN